MYDQRLLTTGNIARVRVDVDVNLKLSCSLLKFSDYILQITRANDMEAYDSVFLFDKACAILTTNIETNRMKKMYTFKAKYLLNSCLLYMFRNSHQ